MMPQRLASRREPGGRAGEASPRRTPARTLRAGVALGLLVPHLTGCYHFVPASAPAVPEGTAVQVDITDRGRVALAERIGPEVRRLDGQLLATTDSSLVLSVTGVEYLHSSGTWPLAGERVELGRDLVSEVRQRQLSRSRSWIMAGVLAAAAVAVSTLSITGFGGDTGPDRPGDGAEPQ